MVAIFPLSSILSLWSQDYRWLVHDQKPSVSQNKRHGAPRLAMYGYRKLEKHLSECLYHFCECYDPNKYSQHMPRTRRHTHHVPKLYTLRRAPQGESGDELSGCYHSGCPQAGTWRCQRGYDGDGRCIALVTCLRWPMTMPMWFQYKL
jgi:hypothetical protein